MTATLIDCIMLDDGSAISVTLPKDGGVQLELRPFANSGAVPAIAVMNREHAKRLAEAVNAGLTLKDIGG